MNQKGNSFSLANPAVGGVELVRRPPRRLSEWTQVELRQFSRLIKANRCTFDWYGGAERLDVWEATALAYFLDPRYLSLDKPGQLEELKLIMYDLEDRNAQTRLVNFVFALEEIAQDVRVGELICVYNIVHPFTASVHLDRFEAYLRRKKLGRGSEQLMLSDSESTSGADLPEFIVDQLAAIELWGKRTPGDRVKKADVVRYFKGKGYSTNLSTAMATLSRPSNAPNGRPPK